MTNIQNTSIVEDNHKSKKNRKLKPMTPFTFRLKSSTLADLRQIKQNIKDEYGAVIPIAYLLNVSADLLIELPESEIISKLEEVRLL